MKDIDPMKLRGPECFAWAILNPGFKIKMPDWNPEEYMLWDNIEGRELKYEPNRRNRSGSEES